MEEQLRAIAAYAAGRYLEKNAATWSSQDPMKRKRREDKDRRERQAKRKKKGKKKQVIVANHYPMTEANYKRALEKQFKRKGETDYSQ